MQLSMLELVTSALTSLLPLVPKMHAVLPTAYPLPCTSMSVPPCTLPMLGCTVTTVIGSMYSKLP